VEWSEISIQTTNEAKEAISNILNETGASGLALEDPHDLQRVKREKFGELYELNPNDYPEKGIRIKAYFPSDDKFEQKLENIKSAINQLESFGIDIGENKISINKVHEEDWATAWKKYYKPVKISQNITIKPTWEDYQPASENEQIIELDPGMAFGTGTHPTTKLSVQALEKYLSPNDTVLDVGSGSGILSIAAAKLGASEVFAYDLDDIAVKSTQQNAALNKLDQQVITKQNDLLKAVDTEANIIVSNILAEIIVEFVDHAWNNLVNGGYFITSGIIRDKKKLVEDAMQKQGFEITEISEIEDWVCIVAKKV